MPPRRLVTLSAVLLLAAPAGSAAAEPAGCATAPVRHAAAAERTIRIETPEGAIVGTLAGPADAAPAALALMLHGYTGARDEIPVAGGEGMFARAARAFAERGVASLRIDFRGSGDSDGAWADTTLAGQARDALRAADALRAQADAPLGVLGYSQGGLVALQAAARGDLFARIALWNPVLDPPTTYGLILGPETLARGAAATGDEPVEETGLKPGFFAGVAAADPAADAALATAAVLIVAGRRDHLVPDGEAHAARLAAGRAAATRVIGLDAGHDLGAVADPALLDAVIACTAAFLLGR